MPLRCRLRVSNSKGKGRYLATETIDISSDHLHRPDEGYESFGFTKIVIRRAELLIDGRTMALSRLARPRQEAAALIAGFLKNCDIVEELLERLARRAGVLQTLARQGSAVDAIVVALAEPHGAVLTGDPRTCAPWPPTPTTSISTGLTLRPGPRHH